jgi:hypothetical protein
MSKLKLKEPNQNYPKLKGGSVDGWLNVTKAIFKDLLTLVKQNTSFVSNFDSCNIFIANNFFFRF